MPTGQAKLSGAGVNPFWQTAPANSGPCLRLPTGLATAGVFRTGKDAPELAPAPAIAAALGKLRRLEHRRAAFG